MFRLWEDWTYAESCYFMYISLSTIGLGDISVARRDMMVLCFVFVIIGLSLVSMSINVERNGRVAVRGASRAKECTRMQQWVRNTRTKALICSGMPKIFTIQENKENEEPPQELEQMVQKQVTNEIPIVVMHEEEVQTDGLEMSDKTEQTMETLVEHSSCQTEELKSESQEQEVQTEASQLINAEAQTTIVEDAPCQTESLPTMDQISQTAQPEQIDAEVATEIETKNARIQTPCPVITERTIQTEDLEDRKSPSKMSSARKRIRRAFAKKKPAGSSLHGDMPTMSDWKDVEEESQQAEEEDGSEESLHWDPVIMFIHQIVL
ncbi:unnamed protein product [Haemonchus placei]|uniref:Potassium channel domain-containing protein n=1 Tax=Haemonchus placei TaxID=6290 RepID=A0A3P7VQA4_HAEPC|nr:unnamed protein product [Haemonchus placei]